MVKTSPVARKFELFYHISGVRGGEGGDQGIENLKYQI
jgi:hypothetical protein